jgi:small subunit ribosomal protein S8|tara:strand:+ start:174 stop:563 length:390 start_codon:yes stop_codon:yes gene_type:complete
MQDPISDMIARVKNAQSRGHKEVLLDSSKIKLGICKVLESEGYIKKVELVGEQPKQEIKITLKYFEDLPVIKEFDRASKPGLRKYFSFDQIPPVKGGLGTAIMTTSKGIITSDQAKKEKVGGELICTVF